MTVNENIADNLQSVMHTSREKYKLAQMDFLYDVGLFEASMNLERYIVYILVQRIPL